MEGEKATSQKRHRQKARGETDTHGNLKTETKTILVKAIASKEQNNSTSSSSSTTSSSSSSSGCSSSSSRRRRRRRCSSDSSQSNVFGPLHGIEGPLEHTSALSFATKGQKVAWKGKKQQVRKASTRDER